MESTASSPAVVDEMIRSYQRMIDVQVRLMDLNGQLLEARASLHAGGPGQAPGRRRREGLIRECIETLAGVSEARVESNRLLGLAWSLLGGRGAAPTPHTEAG